MDFEKLIQKRYSCRHYSDHVVEDHLLAKVLEAARLAPTAANRQPFQIIVIKTLDKEEDLLLDRGFQSPGCQGVPGFAR